VVLADGTRIADRERLGELHLWNERVPPMPQAGPDLCWAVTMRLVLVHSLQLLAAHVENDPDWEDVRAFRGETAFDAQRGETHPFTHLGFELQPLELVGPLKRFTDFWENLYAWWLIWTFNPASLRSKRLWGLQRRQLWLSRATLLTRYGQNRSRSNAHWRQGSR